MIDQAKLDQALLLVYTHFNEGEAVPPSDDDESLAVLETLANRGLINCLITRMVSGRARVRWTHLPRVTPAGFERVKQIQASV